MPSFLSRFKSKEPQPAAKQKPVASATTSAAPPKKPRWEDAWTRKEVGAEEVQELLHLCNQEMKSRALEVPFLLLPFRPNDDLGAARSFIRTFFKGEEEADGPTNNTIQELRLLDPNSLGSVMKWCWSRLRGGVVTWNTYNLFKAGEKESNMAASAFDTFVPLSSESEARSKIIFDFFEILAAVAAHAKSNGLGGRKLSRLAGWWAFEFSDTGKGFDGGYKLWEAAAEATSHLFFAYLRSRSSVGASGNTSIYQLPRSLQALVAQTEYPPPAPTMLLTNAPKVVMIVDKVSPTPFSLLRRARHFDFQANDPALLQFSEYGDPVEALTFECRRVLEAISSINQSTTKYKMDTIAGPRGDESWSRFQDIGFSSLLDGSQANGDDNRRFSGPEGIMRAPSSGKNAFDRPVTPSWADFMSSGFTDDNASKAPASLNLPSDQILPPITPVRVQSSQSHVRNGLRDDNLDPGELASIDRIDLDETFWWVWIASLAGEEPGSRKAVFGRCAFIETDIHGGRWLVMEEQIKGAANKPAAGALIAQKKKKSLFGRRDRSQPPAQTKRPPVPRNDNLKRASATIQEVPNVNSEQQAKVQEAAAKIVKQQQEEHAEPQRSPHDRRGRSDEQADTKTASVMTLGLQPVLQKDAGPAMQWARKFDKESIRARYLGDTGAGKGMFRDPIPSQQTDMDIMASAKATDVRPEESSSKQEAKAEEPSVLPKQEIEPAKPAEPVATQQAEVQRAPSPSPPRAPPKDAPLQPPPEPPSQPITQTSRGHQHKESEKTLVAGTALQQPIKKQTGSVDNTPMDHPALRQQEQPPPDVEQKPSSPPAQKRSTASPNESKNQQQQNPPTQAAAAAAAAWNKPTDTSAETEALRSKKGSTRGFKKLFGRNKKQEEPEPEALAVHRAMTSAKLKKRPRGKSDVSRKRGPSTDGQSRPNMNETQGFDQGEPGPEIANEGQTREVQQIPETIQAPVANGSATNQQVQQSNGNKGFSDFTQGPLEDQPAYVPDEPSPPVPEKDHPRGFQTQTAARLFTQQNDQATAGHEEPRLSTEQHDHIQAHEHDPEQASQLNDTNYATPMEGPGSIAQEHDNSADEHTPTQSLHEPPTRAPPPAPEEEHTDRWAQIRKNAADRRANTQKKTAVDNSDSARQNQSTRTEKTDDGETSGEETIESRVARIRARVAQLTGNPSGNEAQTEQTEN